MPWERDNSFDRVARPPPQQHLEQDNPDVDAQVRRAAGVITARGPARGIQPGPAPAATAPPAPVGAAAHSLERGLGEGRRALELLELVRATLAPGYRRAVDALDPVAALELGRHVVGALQVAEAGTLEVQICLPSDDPHHYMVSIAGQPDRSEAEITARFTELTAMCARLTTELPPLLAALAVQIGPQVFRGAPVLGSVTQPALGRWPTKHLAAEAATTVELVATVAQIRRLAGATDAACPRLDADQRATIAGLVAPWKSRPVNFAFLVQALQAVGLWEAIAAARAQADGTGATLAELAQATRAQAEMTGALADVGELDTATLTGLLGLHAADPAAAPAVDDAAALAIFDKLRSAAPDARGPLIRQLARLYALAEVCRHLPWQHVQALHDAVLRSDPGAAALLRPYFEDQGGGRSAHQLYMDQMNEQLEQDHTVRAFGWFFLDFAHNALTAGFQHEYSAAYDAHAQGFTTEGQFRSQATLALGKAAAITLVSAVTGGVAGELAQGAAAGLGAGRSVAQIIGGGVGGVAAGVGGHLAGDVYDQLLRGKQGFDGVGDYMQSGAIGGAMGAALAGVSVASGQYLPTSARRTIDVYAERFPRLGGVLEDIRASGFRSGSAVRMKVAELLDLLGSGFGGPGGPTAFAYAGGGGDVRALPPDTELAVRLRPLRPLTQPMQASSVEGGQPAASQRPVMRRARRLSRRHPGQTRARSSPSSRSRPRRPRRRRPASRRWSMEASSRPPSGWRASRR